MELGPHRQLDTYNPSRIASALLRAPSPRRGPRLTTALLHAVHALSLPIRMGVDYVSRSYVFYWSCQHSLCGLDTCVFLWRWLNVTHQSCNSDPLTGKYSHSQRARLTSLLTMVQPHLVDENRVIAWLRTLITEVHETVDLVSLGFADAQVHAWSLKTIGLFVLKIWARILSKNSLWPIISTIGLSLDQMVSMLEASGDTCM